MKSDMDTVWIPKAEFKDYIWSFEERADLENVDGFNRWVITLENGTKFIARPKDE